jgi:hypothetical protein
MYVCNTGIFRPLVFFDLDAYLKTWSSKHEKLHIATRYVEKNYTYLK